MDTFSFPYHRVSTKEPTNGFQVSFGNSYTFTSDPDAPDQRIFTLYFTGFKYYVNPSTGAIDATTNASINNMAALYNFYKTQRLNKTFVYPHSIFGNINCKFKDPLEVPDGIPGGGGVVKDFQLSLVEQP